MTDSIKASNALLAGGGEMGERVRAFDWSRTELGAISSWPGSLRTGLSIMLGSRYPMFLWWGKGLVNFYNDAYIPVLGKRHPDALGRPAREVWSEIWDVLGPQADIVLTTGQATWNDRQLLVMERNGYTEETYFSWSYSPAIDESGEVTGVFCACTEDTERVLGERRLRTLSDLGGHTDETSGTHAACLEAARQIEGNPHDIPFAAIYLSASDSAHARLATGVRIDEHGDLFPQSLALDSPVWPLAQAADSGQAQLVQGLSRLKRIASAPWPEPVETALVLPIATAGRHRPAGFLLAGTSARRLLDAGYRRFFDLVAGQIAKTVNAANAYEAERRRAEALAEIDRAKTVFFSNVSHEFRTPLTLMLGTVDDMLEKDKGGVLPQNRALLEVVQRNGQRLLKLVNTLLDFARIEAGRAQASYQPTDLAALASDLASNFRSACERAGLRLTVECPPLSEPAYVDQEMWEKIVLNLLSNAFKFTFQGEIKVSVGESAERFELAVADTGVGIPAEELPRMFERFHRVESARGRSHEGSGIGLALVQELVKLHGGSIDVKSTSGKGTTFTVTIPKGAAHLPAERVKAARSGVSTALRAGAYVNEALSWLPESASEGGSRSKDEDGRLKEDGSAAHILLADDNADLRDYARRLLAENYHVETAGDGEAALAAARARKPDLIVSDVMMPRLDGFGLIRELRADPVLADVPVILLSARAGEETRADGLGRGADDYLVKPFSARELLVRVGALLQSSQARKQLLEDRQRESDALARLNDLGSRLWRMNDLSAGLNEMLSATIELLGAQMGNIQIVDPSRQVLRIAAQRGFRTDFLEFFAEVSTEDDSACGRALRSGGRIMIEDVEVDGPYAPLRAIARAAGYRAVQSTPLIGRDGAPLGMLSTHWARPHRPSDPDLRRLDLHVRQATDFIERCRTDERLREADRRKDEFIATLSHELRNPLAPLRNALELLRLNGGGDGTTALVREMMERQMDQLVRLVDDLLEMSRISRGAFELRRERVEVRAFVGNALETSDPIIRASRHELRISLPPEPLWVSGDPVRLSQILINLLNNAARYTDAGGRIEVRVQRNGGVVEISVRDSGEGIAPDVLPRLFEMFSRGDRSSGRGQGGLGIGLAISRRLAEMHGGSIEARSEGRGKGAEFIVRLPVAADQSVGSAGRRPAEDGVALQKRILVVDDNRDAADSLAMLLRTLGAEVQVAYDGLEGLKAFQAHEPAVVLLDIGMPGMDGYEVVRRLRDRSSGKHVPIVALSGWGQEDDRRRAREAGFDHHLVKPANIDALQGLLRSLSADRYSA